LSRCARGARGRAAAPRLARAQARALPPPPTPPQGLLSNCYRVAYALLTFGLLGAALAGVGLLYAFWGGCALNTVFTSTTLVVGVALTAACAAGAVGRGLLPPAIIFAYNVYLTWSAITNNPDGACNALARGGASQATIVAGLVIACASVTWVAFSSAGSAYSAVTTHHHEAGAAVGAGAVTSNPVGPKEWAGAGAPAVGGDAPGGASPGAPKGSAAAYQLADAESASGAGSGASSAASGGDAAPAAGGVEARGPWLFHLVLALGAMYLAMMATNWGDPSATASPTGAPELSAASMWARMGSVFAIEALFFWSLVAPRVCPDRDFS